MARDQPALPGRPGLPTLSVVTPSFNQAAYLERAILSVLEQDVPATEYRVLDGGSTDGSRAILERYGHRLTEWTCAPDGGQADALASGFSRSTGDVLAWINSDDWYLPGAFRAALEVLARRPDVDLVFGDVVLTAPDETPLALDALPSFRAGDLRRVCCIPQQGAFWRRSACEAVGGIDRSFRFAMDWDLFLRLVERGRALHLPRVMAAFRMHAAAKTSTLHEVRAREDAILRRRHLGREEWNRLDWLRMKWLTARQVAAIGWRAARGERLPTLVPARWNRVASRRLRGFG